MNWRPWGGLSKLSKLLAAPRAVAGQHSQRILNLQRNVVLPAKLLVLGVAFYYLFLSRRWVEETTNPFGVVLETMRVFFYIYLFLNLLVTVSFFVVRRFPDALVQWTVFAVGLADGLFLAGLTLMSGGFDSTLYWAFPGLIVLNALCIPLATPQLALNVTLSIFYLGAGLLEAEYRVQKLPPIARRQPASPVVADEISDPRADVAKLRRPNDELSNLLWKRLPKATRETLIKQLEENNPELETTLIKGLNHLLVSSHWEEVSRPESVDDPTEPFVLRLAILWLLAACCYGAQVLIAHQQLAEEEQKEFAARTDQLHSAGRLAAEVAHQIKNPLAIIKHRLFSRRALRVGKGATGATNQIIQEIEKADRIITQVMAMRAERRPGEKLNVIEELNRAIDRVFPPGVDYDATIQRDYATEFPPLLMQRGHLAESFANLLQNARDVLQGKGHITVAARCRPDGAVEVVIADDGPGIPADKLERVFEAYYTTRSKGTGLGLAIVKHNVELYGGTVRAESELGKGARFTLVFPARAVIRLSRQT